MAIVILSGLLLIFYALVFVPAGYLIVEKSFGLSQGRTITLALAFSFLCYSLLLAICLFFDFDYQTTSWIFRAIVVLNLAFLIKSEIWKRFFNAEAAILFFIFLFYLSITQLVTAFPHGGFTDISSGKTQEILSLPVDNIIPYNFSRYILEDINPKDIDIAPDWKIGERGPIAGLLTAVIFFLLGIKENAPHMNTTAEYYFVYQTLLSTLNLLSLLGVWCLAAEILGRRAAMYAVLLLSINYFYFINVAFSWPKFFAAFFFLASYQAHRLKLPAWTVGVLAAAAILAHDLMMFTIAVFFIYLLYAYSKTEFKNFGKLLCGFFLAYGPWIAYRKFYSPPSKRMLYLHLFCDSRPDIEQFNFASALNYYLERFSWGEIFQTKLYNVVYPFDFTTVIPIVNKHWSNPLALINSIQMLSFFQIIFSLGLVNVILVVYAIFFGRKRTELREPLLLFSTTLFSLVLVGLGSGCKAATSNHHWAYSAILCAAILGGWAAAQLGPWLVPLLVAAISWEVCKYYVYISYHSQLRPYLHASSEYYYYQIFGVFLFIISILSLAVYINRHPEAECSEAERSEAER